MKYIFVSFCMHTEHQTTTKKIQDLVIGLPIIWL